MLIATTAACSQENASPGNSSPTADVVPAQTTAATAAVLLEQENAAPIQNPTWDQVETALRAIDPDTKSYFILSGENGYVQSAGAASRLTVEYRAFGPDSFSHYRLGIKPLVEETVTLSYSGGEIRVRESEILTIEDCASIFESYFDHGTVPDGYHLRPLDETYE